MRVSITLDHHGHFILHQRLIVWPLIIEDTHTHHRKEMSGEHGSRLHLHTLWRSLIAMCYQRFDSGGHDCLSQLSSLSGKNLSEGECYEMRKSGAI